MEKTTSKKNQHFVPRFYLNRFSLSGLGKELSLYNLSRRRFIQRASLSDQAAKRFYYGKDGELEDSLSVSEGVFAQVFKEILSTETLPPHQSAKHRQLLHFAVMTESRNPRKKAELEEIADFMDKYIRYHPEFPDKYRTDTTIKLGFVDPVGYAFVNHNKSVLLISDLHAKLFINKTNVPFIVSDNPIVQYNQFLEQKTENAAITGYASKGLQILFPLSPTHLIMLYDSQVYYVGKRKSKQIIISDKNEVNQLNMLQLLNCNGNIYANEALTYDYITNLHDSCHRFFQPNKSVESKTTSPEGLVTVRAHRNSLRIGLSFKEVFFSTHAARFVPDGSFVYGRDFAIDAIDAFRNDPRFKN